MKKHLTRPALTGFMSKAGSILKWMDWFGGFEITYTNGDTLLQGIVPDQAALHGILSKINDLGLLLLSVDRLSVVNDLPDV